VNEGLSVDKALKVVEQKLSGRASNTDLTELPGEMERDTGGNHEHNDRDRDDARHALGGSRGGTGGSGSLSHPSHHPDDVPDNGGGSGKRPKHVDVPKV
jgi:hypothetical protein